MYLTLFGDAPSNVAVKETCIRSISYAQQITGWLRNCLREVSHAPFVRETLAQYLNLVLNLTNQNISPNMNHELVEAVLADGHTFQAFCSLRNIDREVKSTIIAGLLKRVDVIADKFGLVREETDDAFELQGGGFSLGSPLLASKNLRISFEFDGNGYRDFAFGFSYVDPAIGSELADSLKVRVSQHFGRGHSSKLWPVWVYWEMHRHWSDQTFEQIRFGSFADDLALVIQTLAELGEKICGEASPKTDSKTSTK